MGVPGSNIYEKSVDSVLEIVDSASVTNTSGTEVSASSSNNLCLLQDILVVNQISGAESIVDGVVTVNFRNVLPEVSVVTSPVDLSSIVTIVKPAHGIVTADLSNKFLMVVTPNGPIYWPSAVVVDENVIELSGYTGPLPITDVYMYSSSPGYDTDGIKCQDLVITDTVIGPGAAVTGFDSMDVVQDLQYVYYSLIEE